VTHESRNLTYPRHPKGSTDGKGIKTLKSRSSGFVTPCTHISVEVHQRFGGTYDRHIQGQGVKQEISNRQAANSGLVIGGFLLGLTHSTRRYNPEDCTIQSHRCESNKSNKIKTFFFSYEGYP
jgi:hypothetical protein